MAKSQRVVSDLGSAELRLLRLQVNRLTAQLEAVLAAVAANAAYGDFVTAAGLIDTSDNELVVPTKDLPAPRRFPTV